MKARAAGSSEPRRDRGDTRIVTGRSDFAITASAPPAPSPIPRVVRMVASISNASRCESSGLVARKLARRTCATALYFQLFLFPGSEWARPRSNIATGHWVNRWRDRVNHALTAGFFEGTDVGHVSSPWLFRAPGHRGVT